MFHVEHGRLVLIANQSHLTTPMFHVKHPERRKNDPAPLPTRTSQLLTQSSQGGALFFSYCSTWNTNNYSDTTTLPRTKKWRLRVRHHRSTHQRNRTQSRKSPSIKHLPSTTTERRLNPYCSMWNTAKYLFEPNSACSTRTAQAYTGP